MQLKIDEIFAEKIIPSNDSVRLLDQTVEEMDLTPLMRAYKRNGRPAATDSVTMFKILLYANMEGIYSSHAIEKACQRDINFIWLLNGAKAPNYHAICRFRKQHLRNCAEEMFNQLVKHLANIGEICFEHLFVDGTKIEANANKYSFVWKKSVSKYEIRLNNKLEKKVAELSNAYGLLTDNADEILATLQKQCTVPFVHGRGKRKTQIQRDVEELSSLLERKTKYTGYQKTFGDRNSFSKTDPDATFMHMKEDHMRNSQLKPGYNIQFGVEGEYIVGTDVSCERNDQHTLIPLLKRMEESMGQKYGDVTADAGYESEENYSFFEGSGTDCYIKPANYERSKTKKFKSNMALRENMEYNAEEDYYICQNGQRLTARYTGERKSKTGFCSEVTYYECENCEGCPHKKQCTKAKGNRKLQVSKNFIRQREESRIRITGELGILLRMNRSIQSEGAFGVIKENYHFRRFLLRGTENVRIEILIIAMAYNINKLHAKLQQNRTKTQLFQKVFA